MILIKSILTKKKVCTCNSGIPTRIGLNIILNICISTYCPVYYEILQVMQHKSFLLKVSLFIQEIMHILMKEPINILCFVSKGEQWIILWITLMGFQSQKIVVHSVEYKFGHNQLNQNLLGEKATPAFIFMCVSGLRAQW